jgi:hypothetical protein
MSSGTNGIDADLLRVRRESRCCQTCGGDGQVIVYHPGWTGSRVSRLFTGEVEVDDDGEVVEVLVPTAMEVAAHCVCSLGRWMRERTDRDTRSRIPDVNAIFEGRSRWLLEPPAVARHEAPAVRDVQSIDRGRSPRLGVFPAA